MQITFTDTTGQTKTVGAEKAAQLVAYITKQLGACRDSILACEAIKDAAGKAKYEAQIAAMSKVAEEINAQLV